MKNTFVKILSLLFIFSVFCAVCAAQRFSDRELNTVFGNAKKITQEKVDKWRSQSEIWNYDCGGNLIEHNVSDRGFTFDYVYSADGGSIKTLKYKSNSSRSAAPPPLYWNPVNIDGWEIYTLHHDFWDMFSKKAERTEFRQIQIAFAGADATPSNGGNRVWRKTLFYDKYKRLTDLRTVSGTNLTAARTLYTFDGDFPHPLTKTEEYEYAVRYRDTYKYVLDDQKNWIEKEIVVEGFEDGKFINPDKYKQKRKIDYFEPKDCEQNKTSL